MGSSTHRSQNVLRLWYEAICITLFQVTQQGQVAVKYRRNVGSLSINMSVDNRTIILGRHIGQHIGRVSVDKSTDARPICRPTHLGRHIDRLSTEISVDISAYTRPICLPIHRSSIGRYVDRFICRGVHKIHMIRRRLAPLILCYATYWSGIQFTIVTISRYKSPLTVNLVFLDSCYLADDLEA